MKHCERRCTVLQQELQTTEHQATPNTGTLKSIVGFEFYGTVQGIYYNQPNGYLQVTDTTIGVTPLGWTGENVYPGNDAIALNIIYGSMDIVNSDMENVAVPAWQ